MFLFLIFIFLLLHKNIIDTNVGVTEQSAIHPCCVDTKTKDKNKAETDEIVLFIIIMTDK